MPDSWVHAGPRRNDLVFSRVAEKLRQRCARVRDYLRTNWSSTLNAEAR